MALQILQCLEGRLFLAVPAEFQVRVEFFPESRLYFECVVAVVVVVVAAAVAAGVGADMLDSHVVVAADRVVVVAVPADRVVVDGFVEFVVAAHADPECVVADLAVDFWLNWRNH